MSDLPRLLTITVVDVSTGLALASHSNMPSINPEAAVAYTTEVVRQKQRAMRTLKLQSETIQDIYITLSNQLHLIKLNSTGSRFIHLVVNLHDTNLATAREVLRTHATQLH